MAQVALYRVKATFWKALIWLTLGIVLFISIVFSFFSLPSIPSGLSNKIPATVWTYQDVVEAELQAYNLESYTELVLALITVESGGVGGDIMQASESQGLPPNTIADPLYSIEVGVSYFASLMQEMTEKNVDIETLLQSYNFGTAYIAHVAENGGTHTLPLAEAYSRDVVAPSLGNTTGATYAYPHPLAKEHGSYLYQDGGNFYYADLVMSFLTAAEEAGAFALVLEVIPARLAKLISEKLSIPTIGIGAGVGCGGQVLVTHDLLGVYEGDEKKIAKRYAEVGQITREAIERYAAEVRAREFPARDNSFVMKDEVLDKLY